MPRKKTVSGRARVMTAENRINLQVDRINRRFRGLEKGGNYGTYKSRELQEFVSRNPFLTIKRSRGSKRHKLMVMNLRKATTGQLKLITKKFGEVLKSKVFSNAGIERVRRETRKKVSETLSERMGREMTKAEVDIFYDIAKDKAESSILDQMTASQFWTLVMVAKDMNASQDTWISLLKDYATINNELLREEAKDLYYKYVA